MFQRAVIAGLGLMGGSLALALKSHKLAERIVGVEANPQHAERALKRGLVERVVEGTLPEADLLVLATPVEAFGAVLKRLPKSIPAHTLILDIASVKEAAIHEVFNHLPPALQPRYVPCHPITGSAAYGPDAAEAQLYWEQNILITPHNDCAEEALDRAKSLWRRIGAVTRIMAPEKHDRVYATVSHLPQLLAYAFLSAFEGKLKAEGLEQFLRIGGSNPTLWRGIFMANRPHLLLALDQLQLEMRHFPELSAYGQMQAALAAVATEEFRSYAGPGFRDFVSFLPQKTISALPADTFALHHEIGTLHLLLQQGDATKLESYLRRAKTIHTQVFG